MPSTLHTERLMLRPIVETDMRAFFEIFSDPRTMTFMPAPPHTTIDETRADIETDMARDGAHYWAICLKGESRPIGLVHYLGGTRIPGMGYILHPDHWGQGIMTEACRAALGYGYEQLELDSIELWINEDNIASQRVAQKLGFKLKGRIAQKYPHEIQHHIMLVYGLLASEWRGIEASVEPVVFGVEPVLMVHDVVATAYYYRDKLGFNIDYLYGEPASHAGVSRGEWTGSIVTIQLTRVPPDQAITPSGYLYIIMDTGVDILCDTFRGRGVKIIEEPASKPWGMREFTIHDCNGHRLTFGTHI